MNNYIGKLENIIEKTINECGYKVSNVKLLVSSRKDLGDYQYNGVMALAKEYHDSPINIANKIVEKLKEVNYFTNINVAGPGFINITLTKECLLEFVNDKTNSITKKKERIFIDYGGANVAKCLHVGHLRSANIGQALYNLTKFMGYDVIGDSHFGDFGKPLGLVLREIKERHPELVFFDENYHGEYPKEIPVTNEDLEVIYPIASNKSKEDPEYLKEAMLITKKIQDKVPGYYDLWKLVVEISKKDICKIYDKLNAKFDLYEGESDADPYIPDTLKILYDQNLVYKSEGAEVMDVVLPTDTAPMPPMLIKKSDGALLYSTTELATLYERVKKYNPDVLWYVVDNRQEHHFVEAFRAAKISGIVRDDVELSFLGFGTMNGKDGKPFKSRDGGVMRLQDLLDYVEEETIKRLKENIPVDESKEIVNTIAMGALKYADLLSVRTTDYSFDPAKFGALEGKTAPYLQYSVVRINSLLKKAMDQNIIYNKITIVNDSMKDTIKELMNEYASVTNAFKNRTLNDICDYLYNLTSTYNNFYSNNQILNETNLELRSSYLYLSKMVSDTITKLLDILGIGIPSKM